MPTPPNIKAHSYSLVTMTFLVNRTHYTHEVGRQKSSVYKNSPTQEQRGSTGTTHDSRKVQTNNNFTLRIRTRTAVTRNGFGQQTRRRIALVSCSWVWVIHSHDGVYIKH
ncbi:uncharacterized protein LOC142234746 [Haematobia irritans]|uniref:uncharacterized protein LOC142234746 n=1 Tax=Haematobia irritans TaxID=7368 RepID=UPI003F5042BE